MIYRRVNSAPFGFKFCGRRSGVAPLFGAKRRLHPPSAIHSPQMRAHRFFGRWIAFASAQRIYRSRCRSANKLKNLVAALRACPASYPKTLFQIGHKMSEIAPRSVLLLPFGCKSPFGLVSLVRQNQLTISCLLHNQSYVTAKRHPADAQESGDAQTKSRTRVIFCLHFALFFAKVNRLFITV